MQTREDSKGVQSFLRTALIQALRFGSLLGNLKQMNLRTDLYHLLSSSSAAFSSRTLFFGRRNIKPNLVFANHRNKQPHVTWEWYHWKPRYIVYSPSILANKKSQPITDCNRKYLCSFNSRILSPTTFFLKSRRIELQENEKIPLLMRWPLCSTRKRGYKKVYKFVLIVMPGKRCFLFKKTFLLGHFETVHKVSRRWVMTAGSS